MCDITQYVYFFVVIYLFLTVLCIQKQKSPFFGQRESACVLWATFAHCLRLLIFFWGVHLFACNEIVYRCVHG